MRHARDEAGRRTFPQGSARRWCANREENGPSARAGNSRLTGYVYNQYGEAAENVQLRISEVDASGRAASSVTRPVFGTVPAEDRAYFGVQVPSSPSYQVAVQSFDFQEVEN